MTDYSYLLVSEPGRRTVQPLCALSDFLMGTVPIARLADRRLVTPMAEITVWHDGDCPLCRRKISLMRKLDWARGIDFVDATEVGEGECPIDAGDLLVRFHALENGKLLSGAAAFASMWRAIPILRPIRLAARDRRFLAILEFGCRQFLRGRPRLQRMAVRV